MEIVVTNVTVVTDGTVVTDVTIVTDGTFFIYIIILHDDMHGYIK